MQTGRLRLWTLKTGADVSVRLERPALDALGRLPRNGERVFWATGLLHTVCNEIRVTLNRVGLKAKLHVGAK